MGGRGSKDGMGRGDGVFRCVVACVGALAPGRAQRERGWNAQLLLRGGCLRRPGKYDSPGRKRTFRLDHVVLSSCRSSVPYMTVVDVFPTRDIASESTFRGPPTSASIEVQQKGGGVVW